MENIYYTVERKNVYVGRVVRLTSRVYRYESFEKGRHYSILESNNAVPYRTTLFVPNGKDYSDDLLYRSPHYPILDVTRDDICLSLGTSCVVVQNACNLGALLQATGFTEQLSYLDLLRIKKLFFSGKKIFDKDVFTEIRESNGMLWIPNRDDERKKLEELYADTIEELRSPTLQERISNRQEKTFQEKDAFKPHHKEQAKRLSLLPTATRL